MMKAGYSERSSIGLVTVGGSTGLLFPPSLPVILYGIRQAHVVDKLFIGGLVPAFCWLLSLRFGERFADARFNPHANPSRFERHWLRCGRPSGIC
jgi:TRAP-type C4-dicarboxylate transport system permease large subunit